MPAPPFRPNGSGSYRCYDPRQKKVVSLNTTNAAEAKAIQAKMWAARDSASTVSLPSAPKPSTSTPSLPAIPTPAATPGAPVDARSIIDAWAANSPPVEAPSASPSTLATPDEVYASITDVTLPPVTSSPKRKGGLTPEQSAKIGNGLKGMATRINVVLVGAGVSLFGRDPVPPDEDEVEMLKLGWELMLEQYFIKNTAEPWLLILVGNVMLLVSTFVRSPKRPKPEKKQFAGSAPGQPLSSVPNEVKP